MRVHNILRRLHRGGETEVVSLGDLRMNHGSHEVQVGDVALDLTVKSFELLWLLASNPERVFSKTDLYEKVWQEDYVDDTNTLNVHIHALRQELAKHASAETPTIKLFGVWATKLRKHEVVNEVKKLYFSGVCDFNTPNDYRGFWAIQRMLIEEREIYFLVGMTLVASLSVLGLVSFSYRRSLLHWPNSRNMPSE